MGIGSSPERRAVRAPGRWRASGLAIAAAAAATLFGAASASAHTVLDGAWTVRYHEDFDERGQGPSVGEYEGLPINEAARARGDAWSASLITVPEHQCLPHPPEYSGSFGGLRFESVIDPVTQQLMAYRIRQSWMNVVRMVWMDGRPHPPAGALHTWEGFATGKWEGDVLVVSTTHLKPSYLRRNGLPRSDKGTLTERFYRVGDVLTWIAAINDPVYLTELVVRSRDFAFDPGYQTSLYPCSVDIETVRPEGEIPHHLPGTNADLDEYAIEHNLPRAAVRGGAETTYPEYQKQLGGGFVAAPAARSGRR